MNAAEATTLIAEMAATWPQKEITAPEAAVWRQTLSPWPVQMARKVVADLRGESQWLPTHATFIERVSELARRQPSERELPAPKVCEQCGNTGWVDYDASKKIVRRCGCSKGQVPQDHKPGCTCSACAYGPDKLASYHSGRIGSM